MCKVALTVGPRAAGKSNFCEKVVEVDSTIGFLSRDKLLVEIFGSELHSPYSGAHDHIEMLLWARVQEMIKQEQYRLIILDLWNGSSGERTRIIKNLRILGADQVVAWFFETPIDKVEEWFWLKPGIAKVSEMKFGQGKDLAYYLEDAPRRDYKMFHHYAAGIKTDGFDKIVKINPLETNPDQMINLDS